MPDMVRALLIALSCLLAACGNSSGGGDPAIACTQAPAEVVDVNSSSRPLTIPALREWTPATGIFQLPGASRIVVADTLLSAVAETLAEDLRVLSGRDLPVVNGAANEGDINLALGECDPRVGAEGYRLTIGRTVEIRAREVAGVFYGTRSLLQLLHQGDAIPAGEALDWPRYSERGLMIDAGRKYFTAGWIERHVRELAYLKLNYLHLHLSDNEGFRIESETHPEIVSAEHLSKDEVRAIVALAQRYQITVVPEIDMPGHLGAALAAHPELQLVDILGQPSPERLDVSNPAAVQFAHDLIEEFLPLFPGPYWHAGADEYMSPYEYPLYPQLAAFAQQHYGSNANGKDAIHGFVNDVDALVRSRGKTMRMWHDDLNGGSAVTVNPQIIVEWWTNISPLSDLFPPEPQVLLDRGHSIMNAGWFPTYYVVGGAFGLGVPPAADMRTAYETWEVNEFYGPLVLDDLLQYPPHLVTADEPRNLGSRLNVWCDNPAAETEDQVAISISPRLRIIAQKTWGTPRLVDGYADFLPITDAIGSTPGF